MRLNNQFGITPWHQITMQMKISREKPQQTQKSPVTRWQKQLTTCDNSANKLDAVANRLMLFRVITFVLLLTLIVNPTDRQLYFGSFSPLLVLLFLVGFMMLLYRHGAIKKRKKWFESLRDHHHLAIKRYCRQWHLLTVPSQNPSIIGNNFADLGVTGEQASLKKLFNMMSCPGAWHQWHQWLCQPTNDKTIEQRQSAVKELFKKRSTILRFLHASKQNSPSDSEHIQLKEWLDSDKVATNSPILWPLSLLSIMLFWGSIAGYTYALTPLWLIIAGGLSNGIITFITFSKTDTLFKTAEGLQPVLASMQSRIGVINNKPFESQYLNELTSPLIHSNNKAISSIATIERLSMLAQLRHFGLIYLLAQLTLLWNVHIYTALSSWHKKHRKHILYSDECLSELETLMAVACFAHENKGFNFAEQATASQINLKELGHPLIAEQDRITNDLTWQNEKPMLLISGSNMAGKSTFMRALGLNMLLSRLGAPVCAQQAQWPQMMVKTVIKVEDSLAQGDSYFMAELKRLVDITNNTSVQNQSAYTLCLFDEIMSGTNSHDRTEIFKAIVNSLIQQNVFAIFSTHDMKLADHAQQHSKFELYQFCEQYSQIQGQYSMHFDYQLKPGICQQTNAQTLLAVLGLNVKE
jgi:hypothetical protein